jgi:hypothetical protein
MSLRTKVPPLLQPDWQTFIISLRMNKSETGKSIRRVFRTPEEFQQYVRQINAGKPVVSRKELAIERMRNSQKNTRRLKDW